VAMRHIRFDENGRWKIEMKHIYFIVLLEINSCAARVRLKYILTIFLQIKIIIMIIIIIYIIKRLGDIILKYNYI
jgi:hypothetical protein